jgi:hypothetical protein
MTGTIGFESGMSFGPPDAVAMRRIAPSVKHLDFTAVSKAVCENSIALLASPAVSDLFTLLP